MKDMILGFIVGLTLNMLLPSLGPWIGIGAYLAILFGLPLYRSRKGISSSSCGCEEKTSCCKYDSEAK